jgi:hypothetical protein
MADRSAASGRDFAWLAFLLVVVAGFVASFARMLYLIATKQQLRALVPLPVGLLCAGFLVVVAWRQTVWSGRRTLESADDRLDELAQ